MNVPLHPEINKQDSQLRIHACKSKLFFHICACGKKKDLNGICKISPQIVLGVLGVLGGSLELEMATHFLSFGVTELCVNPNSITYWCVVFIELPSLFSPFAMAIVTYLFNL